MTFNEYAHQPEKTISDLSAEYFKLGEIISQSQKMVSEFERLEKKIRDLSDDAEKAVQQAVGIKDYYVQMESEVPQAEMDDLKRRFDNNHLGILTLSNKLKKLVTQVSFDSLSEDITNAKEARENLKRILITKGLRPESFEK